MLISDLIQHKLRSIARRVYWLWRLQQAQLGRGISIAYPLRLEGSGSLSLGDDCWLSDNVRLGLGRNSVIRLGSGCKIRDSVTMLTGEGGNITLSDGCEIGSHTSLWTGNEWSIGPGSAINGFCAVFSREGGKGGRLVIGGNSHVGDHSTLDVYDDILIGDDVALGGYNIVYTHDHQPQADGPAWTGPITSGKVVIEDGAWIGAGAIILPGVTIGRRAVVAAGAVVSRDVAPGTVVAGVPARPLR